MAEFKGRKLELLNMFVCVVNGRGEEALGQEGELNVVALDVPDRFGQICTRIYKNYRDMITKATHNAETHIDLDRFNYFSGADDPLQNMLDTDKNQRRFLDHITASQAGITAFQQFVALRTLTPTSLAATYRESEYALNILGVVHRFVDDVTTYVSLMNEAEQRAQNGKIRYDLDQHPQQDPRHELTLRKTLENAKSYTREENRTALDLIPNLLTLRHFVAERVLAMPKGNMVLVEQMVTHIDREVNRIFARLDNLNAGETQMQDMLLQRSL